MIDSNIPFLKLLRLGLNKEFISDKTSLETEGVEWETIYRSSKYQSILGVVFDGLSRLNKDSRPQEQLYLKWCAHVLKINQANKKLNTKLSCLFQLLNNQDITAALMKGQGVALYYPNPLRRQCGDIDIYVGSEAYDKTNLLMESLGAQAEGDEIIKHKSWLLEGVEVEVHKEMAVLSKPSHYRYFKKLLKDWFPSSLKSVEIENTSISVAPLQFDAIFLLVHILEHLLREGIGLRQPIDWLLFLDKHKDQLDLNQLEVDLKRTGLLELAAALIGVGVKYLGFKHLEDLLQYKAKDNNIELLFHEIIESGNFGVVEKLKKSNTIKRSFIIRKANSFVNILRRLKRISPLAKGEASWFLWFTIKNGVYTRLKLISSK